MNLTTMIVGGVVAGVARGLFLGPWGGWVKWIGDVYIGLLQMADFINSWLRMKRQDGTIQQLYDYGILGRDVNVKPPR